MFGLNASSQVEEYTYKYTSNYAGHYRQTKCVFDTFNRFKGMSGHPHQ